jgi:hypothetical protein
VRYPTPWLVKLGLLLFLAALLGGAAANLAHHAPHATRNHLIDAQKR